MDADAQGFTLTVHYLLNGNVETDIRHGGANYRWKVKDGVVNVFEHDATHKILWTKCYMFPISVEMSR